jgi:hypothetical protein
MASLLFIYGLVIAADVLIDVCKGENPFRKIY